MPSSPTPLAERSDWRAIPAALVRSMFPWARTPVATIGAHDGEYVVYADDEDDPDSPTVTLVLRVDCEPHHPVLMMGFLGDPPHAVMLAVAHLAHDEHEQGRSLAEDSGL